MNFWQELKKGSAKAWNDVKKGVSHAVKTAGGVIVKIFPVMLALRNGTKALMELNLFGYATKLQKHFADPKFKQQFLDHWKKWGGDPNVILRSIEHGSKRKPVFAKKDGGKAKHFDGYDYDTYTFHTDEYDSFEPVSMSILIASSAAALMTIKNMLKGKGENVAGEEAKAGLKGAQDDGALDGSIQAGTDQLVKSAGGLQASADKAKRFKDNEVAADKGQRFKDNEVAVTQDEQGNNILAIGAKEVDKHVDKATGKTTMLIVGVGAALIILVIVFFSMKNKD